MSWTCGDFEKALVSRRLRWQRVVSAVMITAPYARPYQFEGRFTDMTQQSDTATPALAPGLTGRRDVLVCEHNTAPHTGKLSTPSMIRAMEQASQRAVLDHLPPEQSTVGFEVNIRHVATADMGVTVVANAELERVDGRWLYFKVEVLDGDRTIGVGTHRRAIITLPPDANNRGGGDPPGAGHRHEL